MKILILTPRSPWPPTTGERVVVSNLLSHLVSRHNCQITLVYFKFGWALTSLSTIGFFNNYTEVYLVNINFFRATWLVCKALILGQSLQSAVYYTPSIHTAIKKIILNKNIEIIEITLFRLWRYSVNVTPSVFFNFIDLSSNALKNIHQYIRNPVKKLLYAIEFRRVLIEEEYLRSCAIVPRFVAQRDADDWRGQSVVLNLGVDVKPIGNSAYVCRKLAEKKTLVFHGNLSYPPNDIGLRWFITDVLPILKNYDPSIILHVYGPGARNNLQKLFRKNRDNVSYHGYVDDVFDAISDKLVSIAPILSGSGSQNKIIQALALGLPVVTTNFGLSGLVNTSNMLVFAHDDRDAFATEIINQLNFYNMSQTERSDRIKKSIDNVMKNYNWRNYADKVINDWQKVLEKK